MAEDQYQFLEGNAPDLALSVAKLAAGWMKRCGLSLADRDRLGALDAAIGSRITTPEERVLRAAACDLYDTLCTTPEGRQALLNLGFKPLPQNGKGE